MRFFAKASVSNCFTFFLRDRNIDKRYTTAAVIRFTVLNDISIYRYVRFIRCSNTNTTATLSSTAYDFIIIDTNFTCNAAINGTTSTVCDFIGNIIIARTGNSSTTRKGVVLNRAFTVLI